MDFRGNRGDQSSPTEYKEGTTQNGLPMRVRERPHPAINDERSCREIIYQPTS